MKRLSILFIFSSILFVQYGTIFGQDSASVASKPPVRRVNWGIWGNFTGGLSLSSYGKLNDDLKKTKMFGSQYEGLGALGSSFGGEINFQYRRLIIGFGGHEIDFNGGLGVVNKRGVELPIENIKSDSTMERGHVALVGMKYNLRLGFSFIDRIYEDLSDETGQIEFRHRWMLYGFVGLGFGNMNSRISNYSTDSLQYGELTGNPQGRIDRTSYRDFKASINTLELGIGTRFMLNKKGGIMVGAELGGFFGISGGDWKDQGRTSDANNKPTDLVVKGANPPGLTGAYLRVTLGGGFFSVFDPDETTGGDAYVKPSKVQTDTLTEEQKPAKKKRKQKTDDATTPPTESPTR